MRIVNVNDQLERTTLLTIDFHATNWKKHGVRAPLNSSGTVCKPEEDWEYMIESICEPFSGWDGDYWRTRNWFNALDFEVQMEIWIQRNLGLRPGSRWILGPHDDQIPELWNQYEAGRYRTVDIWYPGSEFGYGYLHPYQSSVPDFEFPNIAQDFDLETQLILVN